MVSINYDKKSTLHDIVPSQTAKNIKLVDMFPIISSYSKRAGQWLKLLLQPSCNPQVLRYKILHKSFKFQILGSSRFSVNTIKRSQSITMVHINTEARTGHPIVKEVLKLLKSALHVPEIVANPFTLNLCLSLTSLKHYRQPLVESLKGQKN